ncbi:MAG: glutamine--fructose-6-phosphate transaminase (isomerizing) [Candidatus Omnitrophota bacterium]|nr:glutamine--fructose-6-phosphate transaminase (isomerizing) [Candidatus Omnitrophota bacterium]
MCGIIGYVGTKEATPILIKGIQRLEYRGYDSAGIAVISKQKIFIRKRQGKIKDLAALLKKRPLPVGTIGISHTRWATHGKPNEVNAHPHADCKNKIALVHNGIIENYETIKSRLIKLGHKFISQTDTEVIIHLIEEYYTCLPAGRRGNLEAAVLKAIRQLKGSYALGVVCVDEPDKLVAARCGSPLIVGVGKGENFIASDAPAILDRTKRVIYLNDGEVAAIEKDRIRIFNIKGKAVSHKISRINFDLSCAEKENFPHFMLKEIFEQPKILQRMLSSRLINNRIKLEGLKLSDRYLKNIKNIVVVACGTAYHAGMVGKYFIEEITRIPVMVDLSSEFRYRKPILNKQTLVIAISQSGETADTLAAVREARQRDAKILAICNVVGSSLTRESDGCLYTHAGPEIGVASTKAYTAQIMMMYLLGLYLCRIRSSCDKKLIPGIISELKKIPELQNRILKDLHFIKKVAKAHSHFGCFLYLGRNINFPTALEGALKLKEISYIPAEGYAAGEMKHGPIALIDEYRAVVCIAPESFIYEKMVSNIQEIRARRGKVIAIATSGNSGIKKYADEAIFIPSIREILSPLLTVLPMQLLAYFVAVNRGCNVDQPRNLAKSVTVE